MFAVSGRRPQDNLFLLNGIEYTGASLINVTPGGTSGQLLGVDAVREFNVVTDTYGADLRQARRRAGQHRHHVRHESTARHGVRVSAQQRAGCAELFRPGQRFPNSSATSLAARWAGPFATNKLFLFGNYEGFRQNLGLSACDAGAGQRGAAGLSAELSGRGDQCRRQRGSGAAAGAVAGAEWAGAGQRHRARPSAIRCNAFARTSARRASTTTSAARICSSRCTRLTTAPRIRRSQNPLSLVNESLREQVSSVQEQHVFSPALLNTARVGFSRASYFFTGSTPVSICRAG